MARTPKLVLDEEAVDTVLALPTAVRRRIMKALDLLRDEPPHTTEDFREKDATGRNISVKAIRPVMIHYWLDGPVDEFRVTRIAVVKPWTR